MNCALLVRHNMFCFLVFSFKTSVTAGVLLHDAYPCTVVCREISERNFVLKYKYLFLRLCRLYLCYTACTKWPSRNDDEDVLLFLKNHHPINFYSIMARLVPIAARDYSYSSLLALIVLFSSSAQVSSFQVSVRPVKVIDIHHQAITSNRIQTCYTRKSGLIAPNVERSSSQLFSWSSDDELQGSDRIKACIPYVLPLLDGDFFGKYIYQRIPPLGTLDQILVAPLVSILQSFPFLSLVLFGLLSIGTRNAEGMSRNVRFNAQQAVLIDLVLIFPTIVHEGLSDVYVPRVWAEFGCNFVWYFYTSAIAYSVVMNLRGKKPNGLPILSDAAEFMTGPF